MALQEVRRAIGFTFLCGSLLVAACATYTAPDAREPLDDGNAGDEQGGRENAQMGGGTSQPSSGAGGAMNAAGRAQGGMAGAETGGRSGGGSGGAAQPVAGSTTGGAAGGRAAGGTGGTSGGGAAGTGGTGGTGGGSGGAGGKAGAGGGGSGGGTVNLITNFGFEANTTGWSVFGGSASIASSTAEAHSGTRSLLITGRTQTYQGPQYAVMDVVTPGNSYSLSLWGKLAASNATGSLMATFRYTCSGGTKDGDNFVQWVSATAASTSAWTRLTAVKAFPTCDDGSMTGAWLYVESPTATLSYYIDDVVLSAQ